MQWLNHGKTLLRPDGYGFIYQNLKLSTTLFFSMIMGPSSLLSKTKVSKFCVKVVRRVIWVALVELECVREVCLLLNLSIRWIDSWRKYSFQRDLMNSNNYLNVVTLSEQHRTIICSSRFREETKSTFKCGFKHKQLVGAATSRINSNGSFNCWCQWSLKWETRCVGCVQ